MHLLFRELATIITREEPNFEPLNCIPTLRSMDGPVWSKTSGKNLEEGDLTAQWPATIRNG